MLLIGMVSILMVTRFYPPYSHGGTEKYVEVISRELVKNGVAITIAGPALGKKASYEECNGVSVYRFPIRQLGPIEFSRQMRNFINESPCDIVHFHTFGALCSFLRIGIRKPYVISTHGLVWRKPGVLGPLEYAFRLKIFKDNFQKAKKILCTSKKDLEEVGGILGDQHGKLYCTPGWVDTQRFSKSNRQELKIRQGLGNKVVIAQIARFAPEKGQHILLQALKGLPKKTMDKYVAFIAGYSFDNDYLFGIKRSIKQGKLEDRVFLLPDIGDDQILDLYAMTDIFVLPSLVEGLPLTLLEAWASKCTIIASSVGGIPYVVKNGKDGLIVPPNDAATLSRTMAYLILNEEARMRMSGNGHARVEKEFSLSNVTRFLIARYCEILSPEIHHK